MQMRYVSQHQFQEIQHNQFMIEAISSYAETETFSSNINIDGPQILSQKTNTSKTKGATAESFSNPKKHLFFSLFSQVDKLREEKESIKEEIDAMLTNFSFILELLSQNLSGSICDIFRSKSMEMNKKLEKMAALLKHQKQQKQQASKQQYVSEENQKLKIKLKSFISKYEMLLEETNHLKKKLVKVQGELDSLKREQKKQSTEYYSKQDQAVRASFDNMRGEPSSPLKLKKLRTFEINRNQHASPAARKQLNSNIKSLDKIRQKIQQLKNEINS